MQEKINEIEKEIKKYKRALTHPMIPESAKDKFRIHIDELEKQLEELKQTK